MRDLLDYQISGWLEDGLLKRVANHGTTAQVKMRHSVGAVVASAVAAGVYFSNLPSGVTDSVWHAVITHQARGLADSAVARYEEIDKRIDSQLRRFDSPDPTDHEAAMLERARIALAAISRRADKTT